MKHTYYPEYKVHEVLLSERNVLALLTKGADTQSMGTLMIRNPDDSMLIVRVESDEHHYKDREPGPMHPNHEGLMTAVRDLVTQELGGP